MEEQVNIPALGTVCFVMRMPEANCVVWLHVPSIRRFASHSGQARKGLS